MPDCIDPKTGRIRMGDSEFVDPPDKDDDEDDKVLNMPAPDGKESPDAEGKEEAGQA